MPILTQKQSRILRPQYDLTNGLVGWWPQIDGRANDQSGFNRNGTLNGGPTYTSSPYKDDNGRNGAISYTSSQYASMGNVLAFEYNDPMSMVLWFKSTATYSDINIFTKQENSGNYSGFGLIYYSNVMATLLYRAGSFICAGFPSAYNDGRWRHIGYTYSGNNSITGVNIYVNGVAVSKTTLSNSAFSQSIVSTAALQINGRGGANNSTAFSSADARIYNRVLSPGEVNALYSSSFIATGLDPITIKTPAYPYPPSIPMLGL